MIGIFVCSLIACSHPKGAMCFSLFLEIRSIFAPALTNVNPGVFSSDKVDKSYRRESYDILMWHNTELPSTVMA